MRLCPGACRLCSVSPGPGWGVVEDPALGGPMGAWSEEERFLSLQRAPAVRVFPGGHGRHRGACCPQRAGSPGVPGGQSSPCSDSCNRKEASNQTAAGRPGRAEGGFARGSAGGGETWSPAAAQAGAVHSGAMRPSTSEDGRHCHSSSARAIRDEKAARRSWAGPGTREDATRHTNARPSSAAAQPRLSHTRAAQTS